MPKSSVAWAPKLSAMNLVIADRKSSGRTARALRTPASRLPATAPHPSLTVADGAMTE
jgi:hypothetical protein